MFGQHKDAYFFYFAQIHAVQSIEFTFRHFSYPCLPYFFYIFFDAHAMPSARQYVRQMHKTVENYRFISTKPSAFSHIIKK